MMKNPFKATKHIKSKPLKRQALNKLYQHVIAEGLFDAHWYQQQHNRHFDSPFDAFIDYFEQSSYSSVSPSKHFDNVQYLREHPEAYQLGISPLQHYVESTPKPPLTPITKLWQPAQTLSERKLIQLNDKRIALVLHIYYADFIEHFADCLGTLAFNIDVFITGCDANLLKEAEVRLNQLQCVQQVNTACLPNRGRNFSFLVPFAKTLLQYDLFCHLHSKKSLFSGRENVQWSSYLNRFLLNDTQVVCQAVNHLLANDKLGLYYPTTFWRMPAFANHWLKNRSQAHTFLERFNIDSHCKAEFFAYPVGGMFWAKPKALRALLEHPWQFDDFPKEPIPADGTLLHTLERSLPFFAEAEGYQQLFYYPTSGSFTTDDRFIYQDFIQQDIKSLKAMIKPYDVVSFDLFDTLIRRRYYAPDYAKLRFGKALVTEGMVACAHNFVKQRNQAEHTLRKRKTFKGDVNIFEVYRELCKKQGWAKSLANTLATREFDLDAEQIQEKPQMMQLAKDTINSGQQLFIITDTYYTKAQIKKLLYKLGLHVEFTLLVSNDKQQRKDNGTLWKALKTDLKKKQISLLHIGDNPKADAQLAGDHGIKHQLILNPMDKWLALGMPDIRQAFDELDETMIKKWGGMISTIGNDPFLGYSKK